jgi:chaperonin GroES
MFFLGGIMFENIRPLYDKVLIKRVEDEVKTPGGIIIPEAAKEKAQTGEVIAVGQGRVTPEGKTIPMQVKKGDIVFFGKYSGTEADEEYVILREEDILGVVEK